MKFIKYLLIASFFPILLPFQQVLAENDGGRYAVKSVLSSGKWVRLKVMENAVYKLTYEDIKKYGINDPAKVKVYGYGGWILDEDFTRPYVDDLPEVSVFLNKGNDGVFGPGDYLLFYGRGVRKWAYNKTNDVFEHENNPYSLYGSYFLTESETGPKEMSVIPYVSSANTTLTTFDDYALHEKDTIAITKSGRELFGESFINRTTNNMQFSFTVPGITSDPGKARLSFAAAPKTYVSQVSLSLNDQNIMSLNIYVPGDYYVKAWMADEWRVWNGEKTERITAKVTYDASDQSVAYLNLIALNIKRSLQYYNETYTFFRNKQSITNPVTYQIKNAHANCRVWDVSSNFDTHLMDAGLSGNELNFTTEPDNTLHEYVLLDLTKSFPVPELVGVIENQNLHALPQTEMLILAPPVFLSQAERLAEAHRAQGLTVTVVNDRLVFNEFSSGTPDATAYRRFMKMFYDRATSDAEKPKYLLLFGDGIFDNRHITANTSKLDPNYYLLTYQVKESVDETTSYGTDDYFGFLDDREGVSIRNDEVDLGIGRFPVSSSEEANNVVNKVIAYMGNTQKGIWKNKVIFTADDTDTYRAIPSFCEHATDADSVARYIEREHPEYIVSKYYMDAYKASANNGKKTYPEAKKSFLNNLKEGCFLVNYSGHGSTTAWSSEDMLNISDVRQMNYENLPVWITATCDFGWFDGTEVSAGELAFLNKNSGAIALYTTSRVVNTAGNLAINRQLVKNIFLKENGRHLRLGDILRRSKAALRGDDNKLNYVLLGDPALRLNYPEYSVRLETVNDQPVGADYVFKALDKVKLTGSIVDEVGNKADKFSGVINSNVFDGRRTIESVTTNNEGGKFTYTIYPNMIYMGNNKVESGSFDFTFTVPLDISYSKNTGKMVFYASDSQSGKDASGNFLQYALSGTNANPDDNTTGPKIRYMYLNTEKFRNGDNVNETPFFFAEVYDEDGINRSGSALGHDIMISIDDNPNWTYILNNYYEVVNDTASSIRFPIPELSPGRHVLTFRIWDILNNPSVDSLNFNVVKGLKPEIIDIQARENPAKTNTYFLLDHDLPETQLTVEIRVYDLTGRPVWTHQERGSSGFLKQFPIEWNLLSDNGNRVRPGVYIYRAAIRTANSKEASRSKKIIVLGQ
jgi:hypothetical protein